MQEFQTYQRSAKSHLHRSLGYKIGGTKEVRSFVAQKNRTTADVM